MFKVISSPGPNTLSSPFTIDTHEAQGNTLTPRSYGIILLGMTFGLGLSMLATWGITAALNKAMGQHNSKMQWGHDFGTMVCVLGATFVHLLNAVRESVHILQSNDYRPLILDTVQPYSATFGNYLLESFSKGETLAIGLKRHGPTTLSMAAAGLFSEFQMDHSPGMTALHVGLVGIIVKSLDILLGSLARQVTLIRHAQQQTEREIEQA